jgi:hypothetical protein
MNERPIEDSAAARAKIRIEKICPPRSSRKRLKKIKLRLMANIISSIDIKIKIRLVLLRSRPKTPKIKIVVVSSNKEDNIILLIF